jgi:predicted glycosyltransferase
VYAEEAHVAAAVTQEGGAESNQAVELTMVGSIEEGNVEALRVAEATICEPKRPKPTMQAVAMPTARNASVTSL